MSESYYGRPVVKPHQWTPLIPWYFWVGGMMGAASVQCVAARARGEHELAVVLKRAALAGALASPVLLIADLGVPSRFHMMLRVLKPTSPMSIGTWLLNAFGAAITASTAAELLGWERTSRALEVVAAAVGPAITVYTAVLIADTATPVWHEAYETLPFLFAASGIGAAGAVGATFAPAEQNGFARRMMIAGAFALPVAGHLMEHRLGKFMAEPYHRGKAGSFRNVAEVLSLAGGAIGLLAGKSRVATGVAAACVASAGVFERFAVSAAGTQSAQNPKYTVRPQRERVDAGRAARTAP
ncbi:MAG TPA: NrfD/PsrC family molybdoenzyme membrane anchor subunit [Candidatus Elarobacter sp.]